MIYFTSDNHFDHANIIKYCGRTIYMTPEDLATYNKVKNLSREEQRKFMISKESVKNMNSSQIKNWNEIVVKGDTVIQIGDFCLSKSSEAPDALKDPFNYFKERLNGNIVFVQGNHDHNNKNKTIIESMVIYYGGHRIYVTHNPYFCNTNYKLNFVGHIHTEWKFKRYRKGESFTDCCNVGVDVWNFRPVTINQILSEYHRWLKTEAVNE